MVRHRKSLGDSPGKSLWSRGKERPMATRTVMFIHGAWMAPSSWDGFKSAFAAAGYRTLTPTWPLMDRPVAELRASPDPKFGRVAVGDIADHHQDLIRGLPEKP